MDSDNLIPLRVMGLSYNQLQNGAYALLLAQTDGPYRIPVVIGAPEAQSIAIALEGIITPRPLTHDLMSTFAQAFGGRLEQVCIYLSLIYICRCRRRGWRVLPSRQV